MGWLPEEAVEDGSTLQAVIGLAFLVVLVGLGIYAQVAFWHGLCGLGLYWTVVLGLLTTPISPLLLAVVCISSGSPGLIGLVVALFVAWLVMRG